MTSRLSENEIHAFCELMTDPDPEVEIFVRKKSALFSEREITLIDESLKNKAQSLIAIKRLNYIIRNKSITSFIKETENSYPDVPRCISLLDRMYRTDIQNAEYGKKYLNILDLFLPDFLSSDNKTLVEKAEMFNLIFFQKCKFLIIDVPKDINDYLVYSLLNEQKGDIIALATLYTALALSCGLDVCPIPVAQGGFRLYYLEDDNPLFFVDLQQEGAICPDYLPRFPHSDKDIIRFYFMSLFSSDMRARYKISPATVFKVGINLF